MKNYIVILFLMLSASLWAQKSTGKSTAAPAADMNESTFSGLKLRAIGPAFLSGRIADIAIHPQDESIWYIAAGSGGVWKTTNSGVIWTPVFENQKSYSIGCVTIDPNDPNIVWVGTGENVGGRHVGYGDGIYRSEDGGAHWQNMGLPNSEHISRIIVKPGDSKVVWVAVQGPLWSKGGDRGLYKTTDGGKTWKKTLGDDQWTGVTEVVIDPRNPDLLYAATWQRARTIANYIGGGPGSGVYRSQDGGETWNKLTNGLPAGNMGKIGLAVSPQQPDVVYADIELDRKTGGLFRSTDRGASWEKRSDVVSGGTGPHYYQELYASPHQFDRLYLMNATMLVSDDGGKTFSPVNDENRHGDNHAITFKKSDPDYLLIGTDGGVYESFDLAKTWRFMENLPLTQFYKVAVDDNEPFYNIIGGTQDNGSEAGPSRTDKINGIHNSDWREALDWDGYQAATEPGNPNIMYASRQEGTYSRIDVPTGEVTDIQPQPAAGEPAERYNWDAPILVSPHKPTRIYIASHRLWKSEDRGDSWTAVSGDLTRNQDRFTLPIMGKVQSWDEAWDVGAMSNFNTITSISESPKQEGLIYAGTDDGIIQVTENGGASWRKIELSSIPGIPAASFINDIKADLFDVNTVYVALDNHKSGDYAPYLIKSIDKGKTWQSIRSNLPDRTLVWRIVQDHQKKELMFAATEFGIYFTINSGNQWIKLTGGVPTIAFRDLAIQKRENDLVGASFGRSFYVFDDYSVLREINEQNLKQEAALFSTRKAWWYVPRSHVGFDNERGSQGADHFAAPNPAFGAVFTYHLKDDLKTLTQLRKDSEKPLRAENKSIAFPGWDALQSESRQDAPHIWLTVKDASGKVVRRVEGEQGKGFHRVAWDLRYPATEAVTLAPQAGGFGMLRGGMLAAPGNYSVTLSKEIDGVVTELAGPVKFEVVPLHKGALPGSSPEVAATFWRAYENALRDATAIQLTAVTVLKKIPALQTAAARSNAVPGTFEKQIHQLRSEAQQIEQELFGDQVKQQVGEKSNPTVGTRLFAVYRGIYHSTYGPTPTHRKSLEIVESDISKLKARIEQLQTAESELARNLIAAGAPWIEGEPLPKK